MQSARLARALALVKVPRILMEKRRQHSAADHDVRETGRIRRPESLRITLGALLIVRSVRRLVDSGEKEVTSNTDYVGGGSKSELVFQLGRERHRILVIDDIKVGNHPQDTLLLCRRHLLTSELLDRHSDHRSLYDRYCELDISHFEGLTRLEDDWRRGPVCKPFGADSDLIRNSRIEISQSKRPCFVASDQVVPARSGSKKFDDSPGNSGVFRISDGAGNASPLRRGGVDLAQYSKREQTNKKNP